MFWDSEGKPLAMGFWGWRLGVCAAFISVMVTACAPALPPTPPIDGSSTPLPVTLTVVKPPGGGSPTSPAPRIMTATPAAAPRLEADAPQCEPLLGGGVQCVGLVLNRQAEPVGWVSLHTLERTAGQADRTHAFALEQPFVPAFGSAPYRFLTDTLPDEIILSIDGQTAPDAHWQALAVEADDATSGNDSYRVRGRLRNTSTVPVEMARAVVVVFEGEQMVGFRVIALGRVGAGEAVDVVLTWGGRAQSHHLSGMGWRVVR